jgi:chromate reductase, NAD(P)H dehydrogenase (quinone)
MRILALSGSLRRGSYNTALARAAAELVPDGVEVDLYDDLGSVPPYDQDLDREDLEPPAPVRYLREQIASADALLVVTPEYNGSVPGVLKNAIDWASAQHRGSSFRDKTVAVAGASTGQFGALWAQMELRKVLGISGARVIEGELPVAKAQERFDGQGNLVDGGVAERLRAHLDALVVQAAPTAAGAGESRQTAVAA